MANQISEQISVYQKQLLQTQQALLTCNNDEDRANLESLENDLKELISLESYENEDEDKNSDESSSSELSLKDNFEEDKKELYKHLINEKCRAPFHVKGQIEESYHNAFIADILSDDDEDGVIVKIFFLNPTHDKMKACDYYFSDRCTFEDTCKYSHGERVKYSRLKQYQQPNYKLLKRKSHVLVKTESSLWKPATIIECSQKLKTCQVKLHNGNTFDCPFSDVLPPIENQSDSSDLSTDDEANDDWENYSSSNVLHVDDNFGEWEKHTTGFGSKILEKLGYVLGSGLGKRGEGITTPVSAKIYVQGKSLDYNMELNERKRQETVEEKSKRESLRQQKINDRNYANQHQVFDFLNNTICKIKPVASTSKLAVKPENVTAQSKAQLNLSSFKIEEDIKKVESSVKKLRESLARQPKDSPGHSNIQKQINAQQSSLEQLQKTLLEVNKEQHTRREKSKLTVF